MGKKKWIQKAFNDIEKKGTEGVCTGDKFGGPTCRPGTKRYNMAKNLRKMAKKRKIKKMNMGGRFQEGGTVAPLGPDGNPVILEEAAINNNNRIPTPVAQENIFGGVNANKGDSIHKNDVRRIILEQQMQLQLLNHQHQLELARQRHIMQMQMEMNNIKTRNQMNNDLNMRIDVNKDQVERIKLMNMTPANKIDSLMQTPVLPAERNIYNQRYMDMQRKRGGQVGRRRKKKRSCGPNGIL